MATTSFQTWAYSFVAPLPFGSTTLDIVRYKPNGVRLLIVSQLIPMLRLSAPRFKELVAGMEEESAKGKKRGLVKIFRERDVAVLRRLQDVGAVSAGAEVVLTVTIKDAIKLMCWAGAWEVLLPPLRVGNKSEPTSSANDLGTSKLDRATAPLQPLPMTMRAVMNSATADYEDGHGCGEEEEGAATAMAAAGVQIPWPAAPPPWQEREGGGATPPKRRLKPAPASPALMASPTETTSSPPSKWAGGRPVQARMINTTVGR